MRRFHDTLPRAGGVVLRTQLHETHARLGATFTQFAGYEMPVHYGSIREEHLAVRSGVGLFDVSHMSNLWIEGPGAAASLGGVTPKDPAKLEVGRGHYSVLLRDDGTILDDIFIFRVEPERYMAIPNAGMNQSAQHHIAYHASGETAVVDETSEWAILALQGPQARKVLAQASDSSAPKFHHIAAMDIAGAECLVSGTGYTGEKGVELYVPGEDAVDVWDALMAAGQDHAIRPIGLGARDTLRLEKGYCLAGNEFAGGRTPLEAGLGFTIDWDHEFRGKEALLSQRSDEHDVLVGLVQDQGVPRHGYEVFRGDQRIGAVTSGTMSPSLGKGIALAYLRGVATGAHVEVEVRGRRQGATVVQPPFL